MLNKIIELFIITCICFLACISKASCSKEIESEISAYINQLNKAAIPFMQISSTDSNDSKGILLIDKPHKFRVNYDTPHPLVIVGGKNFVSIYDYSLDELSRISAKDNIFKFLLDLDVSLTKNISIDSCQKTSSKIEMSLIHNETNQRAKIIFSVKPVALKELIIPEDGTNFDKANISLHFSNPLIVSNFPKELFILKDNKVFEKPKRFSSEEILKLVFHK